jgi:hypothetical protein
LNPLLASRQENLQPSAYVLITGLYKDVISFGFSSSCPVFSHATFRKIYFLRD